MLLENVFNCFHLTRLVIVTLPADAPHLEIFSQNTMPSMKLKQLTEGATKHGTYERFQRIGGYISSISLRLSDDVVLAEFTWYFIIWLPFTT